MTEHLGNGKDVQAFAGFFLASHFDDPMSYVHRAQQSRSDYDTYHGLESTSGDRRAWTIEVQAHDVELTFSSDAETHELRRKLTLSKCRYSTSLPGPHDYGLEGESLAVWPDLLRVATGGHNRERLTHIRDPIRIAVPIDHGRWTVLGPAIVISGRDDPSRDMRKVSRYTPGAVEIPLNLGSITDIGVGKRTVQIHDNQGAAAVGWAVLTAGREVGANFCFIRYIERLLSRKGWTTPIIHLLEGLRELGFLALLLDVNRPRAG